MASQRLDEIRDTLKEQREALWEGAIKSDPELFVMLAERIGLSRSTGEQTTDNFWRTLPQGNPESHAPDTLTAQREKLWESAIKADPELFFKAAEKAGLGSEIRPFADQADRHAPSSHVTDDPTFSYEPR